MKFLTSVLFVVAMRLGASCTAAAEVASLASPTNNLQPTRNQPPTTPQQQQRSAAAAALKLQTDNMAWSSAIHSDKTPTVSSLQSSPSLLVSWVLRQESTWIRILLSVPVGAFVVLALATETLFRMRGFIVVVLFMSSCLIRCRMTGNVTTKLLVVGKEA